MDNKQIKEKSAIELIAKEIEGKSGLMFIRESDGLDYVACATCGIKINEYCRDVMTYDIVSNNQIECIDEELQTLYCSRCGSEFAIGEGTLEYAMSFNEFRE